MSHKQEIFINGVFSHIEDTRTLSEAHEENLTRIRELTTAKIFEAGYDEIWQRNTAMGVITQQEAQVGINYIAACRNEYLRCKALILTATSNDEADAVQFIPPSVPENL
jgi:hypothetical protein